jgi:type IV pilus assembly protein PilW
MKRTSLSPDDITLNRMIGFTLIELMIAMTISMVLLGGVIQVFISSKQAYRLQESQARMQENARFIFAVLSNSIRQAGYTGCNSRRSGTITNTLNHSDELAYRFEIAIEGFEALTSHWNPTLDPVITSPLPGNDILVVRGQVDRGVRVVPPLMGTRSAALHVTSGNNLKQADVVMVSDCVSSAIFQISNATPRTGTLVHNRGNVVSPSNATTDLGKIYQDDAEIIQLVSRVFYIRTGVSGMPSLYQKVGTKPVEELVEGVEGMQILYGEDINGDANADRFLPANDVDMGNVVSVRISILLQTMADALTVNAQSYTFNGELVTPTDHRVRRVFTTTIALRNRIP